ncbi:ThuA domain-containing protein [Microbacterium sp. zg.Y1090]|uniref:ThuA domain-containing protein n=1 Tax=Microbacterium TaxID=33882 RepID=UPI00214B5708|nr:MULTISPECIES: ThuA domain-containing protein [unclassified Microbacterium]MCR2812400.1 ThuA domain-containing protein [Microbacterium sp. zg.Y1084]MCR2817799.1 ThuA domain-containing protein [Microbacterium sp. zg.Y1090]MDL5485557.1 ThuA domain-containing protein [Microbacterium sp. zg-Y1211]WIM28728.1 ThuA domain-containing protein [Microbacterium sp. zg-Y1090]
MTARHALIVRGGGAGYRPVDATEMFLPFLEAAGFTVRIEASADVYTDDDAMSATDLVLQCLTDSPVSDDAVSGLRRAVQRGTGLAGWHAGILDTCPGSRAYRELVGGAFVSPAVVAATADGDALRCHTVDLTSAGRRHAITAGLEDFTLRTDRPRLVADDPGEVLATTGQPGLLEGPARWSAPSPAVWTRRWDRGRVFVTTAGHSLAVLRDASVRTIIERGLLWAARSAPGRQELHTDATLVPTLWSSR